MGIVPNGGNNFFKRSCRLSDEEDLTTAKTKKNGHDETFVGGGWGVTTQLVLLLLMGLTQHLIITQKQVYFLKKT